MNATSASSKFWDSALKICIALMPFIVLFLVWVTTQIFDLKAEAALSKQARTNLVERQVAVEEDIEEIKNTQLQILLVLEQIKVSLQKSTP